MAKRGETPLKAIRARCLACCGGSSKEVRLCPADGCPLHPHRMGRKGVGAARTPMKAIRAKCYDCGEGTAADIRGCEMVGCPLHSYRFGKRTAKQKGARKQAESAS
jgi:hypothetical protein